MSREADIAFRTVMWRTLPFDLVNADARLINLFIRIPPHMKLNKKIFLKAIKHISPICMKIRDSNTGVRPNGSEFAAFIGRTLDWLRYTPQRFASPVGGIVRQGAWLDWVYYAKKSSLLKEMWKNIEREHSDTVCFLLGWSPFKKPWQWLAENHQIFHRVFTLGLWLGHRIK
jgi:hypothetical protein